MKYLNQQVPCRLGRCACFNDQVSTNSTPLTNPQFLPHLKDDRPLSETEFVLWDIREQEHNQRRQMSLGSLAIDRRKASCEWQLCYHLALRNRPASGFSPQSTDNLVELPGVEIIKFGEMLVLWNLYGLSEAVVLSLELRDVQARNVVFSVIISQRIVCLFVLLFVDLEHRFSLRASQCRRQ